MDEHDNESSLIRLTKRDDVSQLLLDETHSVIFVFDVQNELMEVTYTTISGERKNRKVKAFFSSKLEGSVIHPDFRQLFIDFVKRVMLTRNSETLDYVSDYNGTGYSWYRAVLRSVKDKKNGGQYLIGIAENIESEKHAEYVYAETEGADHNQKSDILSTIRINVTKRIIEEYHRFTINPVFVDKIPFDTTIIENFFKDIIDPQEKETIIAFFKPENIEKQFYKGKTESGFDYRIRTETGSVRWIHINTRLLLKPLTNELMAYCYIKDIHDRKISESLIQNIAENEYDYIMYIDAENDTYSIYSHAQSGSPMPLIESNSYERERSKNINLYVLEEDRERVLEQMSLKTVCRELDKNRVYSVYLGINEQDGRISRKKLSYSYIQKEQKLIRLSRTDVTKIYEDEQEKRNVLRDALAAAEQASLAKTEFLSRMSHEMRTPMNAIMGLISLVQQQIKSEPAVQENLQKIQSSAQYLLSIINDVLDMSRIESGKMTLQKEKIDITEFIGKVDSIILSQARAKGLEYTSRISDSVFHSFVGDSLKLQQVLVNILGNAVKFTPKGGSVSLLVEQIFFLNTEQKRKLRFTVSDTGIGIKKKYLPLIFDSFTQQDNSISTNFGGTGLGLAITKNILTMMGGSISVKSREGEGSVFTIEVVLPIYDEFTANKNKEESQSGKEESLKPSSVHINTASDFYKGKRLLLVDDNEMNIDVAKQLLVRKGFTVDTAENGKIAVELFEKSPGSYYSAILMDVRMPVMDGLTAARLIRSSKHEDSARIPIIAMTANAFSEDIKQTQESGMNAHLSKPIDVDVLYTTISCLIAGTC